MADQRIRPEALAEFLQVKEWGRIFISKLPGSDGIQRHCADFIPRLRQNVITIQTVY
ncbi:hypothetical protein D3C75_1188670 [compost metagenome]